MRTDNIAFMDIEGYPESREHRYGILIGKIQHKSTSASKIRTLLENNRYSYICGHNFFQHDLKITGKNSLAQQVTAAKVIDTLYLSMLLSPGKTTHRLNKPYKTDIFIENQPAADCVQTKELLLILTERFENLSVDLKDSFYNLLFRNKYFQAYFQAINYKQRDSTAHITLLKKNSHLSIKKLNFLAEEYPAEIAILCSALINKNKKRFRKSFYILIRNYHGFRKKYSLIIRILMSISGIFLWKSSGFPILENFQM